MRQLRVLVTIAVALALQTTLARFLVHGPIGVDLVLVAVVYLGLTTGPTAGVVSGTLAGLAQDALSSGIIGIGGLAKTVVGYLTGIAGTQFIVARPIPRFVVFVAATILHAVLFMGAYELLGVRHFGFPWSGVLSQGGVNAIVGVVAFQAIELLPGAVERRAANRGRLKRRLD